eukprot:TRINITY_DN4144_c1_g1_i1.p1 TRINITY_DN4144_c1_g1~~TRINITY_DN4144_c1_g1_i1.p1  ORF type:complete len:408 (-),score=186.65 TRINITY_DN4144_c1_g1_i1:65-1288(-)
MGAAQSTEETKQKSLISSSSQPQSVVVQQTPKRRNSSPDAINLLDPRSPSQQRTPIRESMDPVLSLLDPRSPSEGRTPLKIVGRSEKNSKNSKSLELYLDPRSPLEGRTPVHPVSNPRLAFFNVIDPRSPMEHRTPLRDSKIIPSPSASDEQTNAYLETPYQPNRSKAASRLASAENMVETQRIETEEEEKIQRLEFLEESMISETQLNQEEEDAEVDAEETIEDELDEIVLEGDREEEPSISTFSQENSKANYQIEEENLDNLDQSIDSISHHFETIEINQGSPFVMKTTPVNSPLRVNKSARKPQISSVENSPSVIQINANPKAILSPNASPLGMRKQTPQKLQKFADGKENQGSASPLKIQNISSSPLNEKNIISASKGVRSPSRTNSPTTGRRGSFTPTVSLR